MAGGRAHTSGAVTVSGTSRAGMRSQIVSSPVVQKGSGWASPQNPRRLPQAIGAGIAAVGLALSSLADDFNDNTVDAAKWPNSFGTFSETGGRARVSCDAGFNAYSSALTYRLSESQVSLRAFPPAAGGATTEAWTQVLVKQQTSGTDLGFEISPLSGNLTMFSRVGFFDAGAVAITYDATAHAWLRVRETGGTTYWETSPDGSTWTQQRTLASPTWATDPNLEFQLIAHRSDGTADFAEFDNVNIAPAAVALTPAAETDSGQTLGARKTLAMTVASETETAQTLGRVKTRALSPATETDAAQAIGKAKSKALPTPAEVDTAQPLTRGKRLTTSPSSEVDSGQALGRRKTRTLAAPVSTETAQPVTRSKVKALGTASAIEATQALRRSKTRALAPAVETDTVQALTVPGRLTAAQETDGAQQIGKAKRLTLAPAVETGAGLVIARRKVLAVSAAVEVATAFAPIEGQPVDDIDVTVGSPYSPWSVGAPQGQPWPAGEPESSDWEVAVPW